MNADREAALRRAAMDRRTQGRPLRVYAYLFPDLDFEEYRPVKLLVVAQQLRIAKGHASHSLRLLVVTGHLEAGPVLERVNSFRLGLPVRSVKELKVPPKVTNSSPEDLVA
jgi:hypothetical protein